MTSLVVCFLFLRQKNNCALYEQNRQVPSLSGHPTTAACGRGTAVAMALQRPDPEQIHQSLLAAIRSGEAAAKLRRVKVFFTVPTPSSFLSFSLLNNNNGCARPYFRNHHTIGTSINDTESLLLVEKSVVYQSHLRFFF